MGGKNSGRRPRPRALQGLFGRTDRSNPAEPILNPAPASFDSPPAELDGDLEARAEWIRAVPTLRAVGLVSELERSSLITLCRCWSRLVWAEKEILASGAIMAAEGGPVVHPAVKIADTAFSQCLKLWQELGMTPSGRTKMATLVKRQTPAVSKWAGVV